jgi:hypothetical protein
MKDCPNFVSIVELLGMALLVVQREVQTGIMASTRNMGLGCEQLSQTGGGTRNEAGLEPVRSGGE